MNKREALITIGGILPIVNPWWGSEYYLGAIGGAVVLLAFWAMK